jgi:hypothetical protein
MEIRNLTVKGNGLLPAIKSAVTVSTPTLEIEIPPVNKQYMAIWDTGATNSVVTPTIVKDLGLRQTGVKKVHAAGITEMRPTYLVDIYLPNKVVVTGVEVTEATLTDSDDVLIGMDIITLGDFSITNANQKTTMSFRIPSIKEVDFVAEGFNNSGIVPLDRKGRRQLEREAKKQAKHKAA